MALQKPVLRPFDVRVVLVLIALLSLCVSNNVGPCFLPLPVVTDCVAQSLEHQNNTVSGSSSPTRPDSFRVPMMGQTQKRANKDNHAQPLAGAPRIGFVLPGDARVATFDSPIPPVTAQALSQPRGRAPPRLG
jgi:hypothetical protein